MWNRGFGGIRYANSPDGELIKSVKKLCNVIKEIESVITDIEVKNKLIITEKLVKKNVVSDESLYI
jgi:hypothetical protein